MAPNQTPSPFAVHQIVDPQHRLVAAAFEYPPDWQAQSGVFWNFQNTSLPVKLAARAFHPSLSAGVEFYPVEAFYWIDPNMGFQQPGQETGGCVLMPPMSAADAMMKWVLPRIRGRCQGMRVLSVNGFPQLPQVLNLKPAQNASYEGVAVGIEYSENGRSFEEEFFGVKTSYPGIPTYGAAGTLVQYNWGFERLFSFRAEKGRLAEQRDLFWHIVRSVQVNPQWEQLLAQVLQQLQQQFNQHLQAGYAQINAATQLSHQISAQNQNWLDQQQHNREAAYQADQQKRHQEQDAYGKYTSADAFGDMMLGQETYNDPYYQYGSQHSGYHEHVWTDSQGNYQYSNDANFDPNIGGTKNWVELQKKQVGE